MEDAGFHRPRGLGLRGVAGRGDGVDFASTTFAAAGLSRAMARALSAAFPELLVTSSESKAGIAELRTAVLADAGI